MPEKGATICETTSSSYFLVDITKHGHRQRKPEKSSLIREIVAKLLKDDQTVQIGVEMVVIDLMAFIRKLQFKKPNRRTYGDLAATLKERIMANSTRSSRST